MKSFLFSLLAIVEVCGLSAQTATVTPSATTYDRSSGGQVTFTVNFAGYDAAQTGAIGIAVTIPSGWSYVSTGGTNIPNVKPSVGSHGELDWAYTSIPSSPSSFTFAVSYPAGLTGAQSFASEAILRCPNRVEVTSTVVINPVGSASATVTLSGMSATYDGKPHSVTATTSPAGLPVSVTYNSSATAPVSAGTYAVVATITDPAYSGAAAGTLTIAKAPQTITFAPLPAKKVGDGPFLITATSSSGLPLTFTSVFPTVAGMLNGSQLCQIIGAGTTPITASQAGDLNWLPATSVTQILEVLPAPSNNGGSTGGNGSGSGSSNPGSNSGGSGSNGSGNNGGSSGSNNPVAKKAQSITVTTGPCGLSLQVGNSMGNVASATSGLQVAIVSSDTKVARIDGDKVTAIGAGTVQLTFTQSGNDTYEAAAPVRVSLVVLPKEPEQTPASLLNGSSLVHLNAGEQVFSGFVLTGGRQVLIRAVGPSLAALGVNDVLAEPKIALCRGTTPVALTSVADPEVTADRVGAFPLGEGTKDVAVVTNLDAGCYSVVVTGADGTSGHVLVEVYDVSGTGRLVNVSTRATLATSSGNQSGTFSTTGFVVARTTRYLIRGVTASLASFGIESHASAPTLTLYRGKEPIVYLSEASVFFASAGYDVGPQNKEQVAAASSSAGAFALNPTGGDTAAVFTLEPGVYTLTTSVGRGLRGGDKAEVLTEVYELP